MDKNTNKSLNEDLGIGELGNSEVGEEGEKKEMRNSKFEIGRNDQEIQNSFKDNPNLKSEVNCISSVQSFAVKQKLLHIKEDIEGLLQILEQDSRLKDYEEKLEKHIPSRKEEFYGAVKTIEGVFDGTRMVGEDGEKYDVPPNYASKSKLVEGDILKLRILENGRLIYKQIEKVERKNSVGKLLYYEDTKEYFVILENGRKYKVLPASITYYRAVPGDEIIITIPASGGSAWAAVESISKKQ
ncbi:hypothetical protein A2Y83_00335 [Candidatus Falkowbacteria bacterium RBG_13_39_14]|uniref:50S ribosomal protein L7/L12 n=1 Tax=Candidatus Falkowbacteria bacterium RBG_13_39_14 TaxID=1797985 RepID=A0A1F5S7E6_9BACT|nr:MAG: hypothetical protein A2Y83_00335 [Candidatus Falkowbacteria bacterium RBG_13_39_14]